MKLIGINGSPRKQSNTRFLLAKALETAQKKGLDIEILDIANTFIQMNNPFCVHCSSPCNKSCYLGTPLEADYDKLAAADGIVLASPVYFGSVSAQLKAFWDKTRALRSEYKLVGKIGAAISVGGAPYGGQETTVRTLHDMMLVQGMTVVGDGLVSVNAGHQGVSARQPVFDNESMIANAERLGLRVANEIILRSA